MIFSKKTSEIGDGSDKIIVYTVTSFYHKIINHEFLYRIIHSMLDKWNLDPIPLPTLPQFKYFLFNLKVLMEKNIIYYN